MTIRVTAVGLLAAVLVVVPGRAAAQGTVVGKITDLAASSSSAVVHRGHGVVVPATLMMALRDGDVVVVGDRSSQVQIQIGDRPAKWLCAKGSAAPCELFDSVRVVRSGRAQPLAEVWAKCGASLSRLLRGDETGRDILAVRRRGDAMVIPSLAAGTANLASGTRALTLAWQGGDVPYEVRLYRSNDGTDLFDVRGITTTQATAPAIDLAPGDYVLQLIDGTNHRERVAVHVTERAAVPRPAGVAPPPSMATTTVSALWLANQGDGAWVWEALLRVTPLAGSGYAPAKALQALLNRGVVPPPE